jgi:hypothetical protein
MEEKESIEKIKEKYNQLKEKYFLPEFNELNREFGIEKSNEETEFILREVVHFIADKIQNYMRFLENLINPANASMFTFSLIKTIDNEGKKELAEIYKDISEMEIKLIKLDLKATEEAEAEFIKYSFNLWKKIREKLSKIIESVEKNDGIKPENNNKGYFG